ncbi:MAG: hypothetical protein ACRDRA_01490 [Pseudonocardiaceae bacterium]
MAAELADARSQGADVDRLVGAAAGEQPAGHRAGHTRDVAVGGGQRSSVLGFNLRVATCVGVFFDREMSDIVQ